VIKLYLALLDNISNNGTSLVHGMNSIVKILAIGLLFIAILLANQWIEIVLLFAILLSFFLIGEVPLGTIGHLALYPAFFSLLFAIIKIFNSWWEGILIVARSVLAALSMLLLISTTPYNEIMAIFSRFMPPLLVDIFIFTYRAFFILVDQIGNMLRSVKLRGGYHRKNLVLNIKNMAATLGELIIHSIEMSERMYMIYTLRGYDGKLNIMRNKRGISITDILFLIFCSMILIGVIIL